MAKLIDINEWIVSGGGGAGVSYFHKSDPDLILKMENREISLEKAEAAINTARIAYGLGVPTPEPGEVVFDGTRYGQVFRRIQNKISYARLSGEHSEMIPQLAHDFAVIIKNLHSTKGYGTGLRSIKEPYGDFLRNNPYRPKEVLDRAQVFLENLPDADTCVHGDLHFGNIIKSGEDSYLIDMSSFGYGHPYFDIAMMVAIRRLSWGNPQKHQSLFHCTVEMSDLFWRRFMDEYFGPDVTDSEIERMVAPFYAVRMLTMETESGNQLPPAEIQRCIDLIMG